MSWPLSIRDLLTHLTELRLAIVDRIAANRPLSIGVSLTAGVVITLVILVVVDVVPSGFGGTTLWDWMKVLGVPVTVVVIGGVLGFAAQGQSRRAELERELASERAQDSTLREYLDRMSDLILSHKLRDAPADGPVRAVAQARTLGALRTLNGPRKGIILRFLHESKLIRTEMPIISLALADLKNCDLSGADLAGSDLSGANLRDADFDDADLRGTNLRSCAVDSNQLQKAKDLSGATMPDGNLFVPS